MEHSRSHLYLLPSQPLLDDEEAIAGIARVTGVPEYDVRQRCGKNRLSLVMRADDTATLEPIRRQLAAQGHAAAVLTDREMRRLPCPIAARGVSVSDGALSFLDAEGRVLETLSRCRDAFIVVTNLKRPGRNPVPPMGSPGETGTPARIYEEAERELAAMLSTHLDGVVIDVVAGGGRRVRLRSRRFNFMTLGEQAGPGMAGNLQTLFAEILRQVERPIVDLGFGGMRPPSVPGTGLQLIDGLPCDRPENDTERELENYVRCLTLLWRKNLFEALMTPPVPGARFRTTSIGDREATNAEADTERQPHFWIPPAGASSSLPGVRAGDLRRLGPLPVVLPLAAGMAASGFAAFHGHPSGFGAGLALAGLLSGVHAFELVSRRRRIENVPTSRIRSAAIGMAEVRGKAKALTPLRTPFSSMPCVYYEYRIVTNDRPDPAVISWQGLWGEARSREEAAIRTGHSGHIPFLIEDETGAIEVDPAGAVVEVRSEQSLTRVPFAGGMVPAGTQVMAWEKYIPEGYTVYVLGEVKQESIEAIVERGNLVERIRELKRDEDRMAACDLDENGVVDDREWSLATAAIATDLRRESLDASGRTDRVRIGRPARGGLFLVSERSEKKIVRSLALRSRLLLAAGAILVISGLTVLLQP